MIPARLVELGRRRWDDLPLDRLGLELPPAAVLMLLWGDADAPQLLLTRRAARLRTQPGDIALPGGRCDLGEIELVGRFDESWSSAGSRVVPVVGWTDRAPELRASPDEVADIIVVPLADLADPANHGYRVTPAGDHEYRDSVITVGDVVVYGFTADLVLDLTVWLSGGDRRRTDERLADLVHFAGQRGWR